jgi:hypothetical protein
LGWYNWHNALWEHPAKVMAAQGFAVLAPPASCAEGISIVMGVPLYRWLVYFMEHPIEMDDLEVPPL